MFRSCDQTVAEDCFVVPPRNDECLFVEVGFRKELLMKVFVVLLSCLVLGLGCVSSGSGGSVKTKVAVITGGHKFDEQAFPGLFDSMPGIEYTILDQGKEGEFLDDIDAWPYDAVVLYNMSQELTEQRRNNFVRLLDRGVGLVVLHHAMVSYQDWPEYREIIGCKYFQKAATEKGVTYAKSTFKHDVDFDVTVENQRHPVTKGLGKSFAVHDETYKGCAFNDDIDVLLTTHHPDSDRILALAKTYNKSKVCFILLGHGPGIFSDQNYQRLVRQAIQWTLGKAR